MLTLIATRSAASANERQKMKIECGEAARAPRQRFGFKDECLWPVAAVAAINWLTLGECEEVILVCGSRRAHGLGTARSRSLPLRQEMPTKLLKQIASFDLPPPPACLHCSLVSGFFGVR